MRMYRRVALETEAKVGETDYIFIKSLFGTPHGSVVLKRKPGIHIHG